MGTKEGVAKTKKILEQNVAQLASITAEEVTVPDKFHKNFTGRRPELINKISEECGRVQIVFPRAKDEEAANEQVKVKVIKNHQKA